MPNLNENLKRIEEIILEMEDIFNSKRCQNNLAKLQKSQDKITSGGQQSILTQQDLENAAIAQTKHTNKLQADRNAIARRGNKIKVQMKPSKEQETKQLGLFGDSNND